MGISAHGRDPSSLIKVHQIFFLYIQTGAQIRESKIWKTRKTKFQHLDPCSSLKQVASIGHILKLLSHL